MEPQDFKSNESVPPSDAPNLEQSSQEAALIFLAKLYSKPNLSRKTVDEIVSFVEKRDVVMLQVFLEKGIRLGSWDDSVGTI